MLGQATLLCKTDLLISCVKTNLTHNKVLLWIQTACVVVTHFLCKEYYFVSKFYSNLS